SPVCAISSVGHRRLPNSNTVWVFHGKPFPWGQAVTHRGRGAPRLRQRWFLEPRSPGDAVTCPTGRAGPWEANVMGGHGRAPSIRGALAPAECQSPTAGPTPHCAGEVRLL